MAEKLSRIKRTALEILAAATLAGVGNSPNTPPTSRDLDYDAKPTEPEKSTKKATITLGTFFDFSKPNALAGIGGSELDTYSLMEHEWQELYKDLLAQNPVFKLIDAAIKHRLDHAGPMTDQERADKKIQLLKEIDANPNLLKTLIDEYARSSPEARKLALEAERYEAEQSRKNNPLQL